MKVKFIFASGVSLKKSLLKSIASVLNIMFKQVENYNSKYRFFQELIFFWIVPNNESPINTTKTLNEREKADIIMAFGFPTIYTKKSVRKFLTLCMN